MTWESADEERLFRAFEQDDLLDIADRVLVELERFLYYGGMPPGKFAIYANRLVGICLCQGAAQWYTDLRPELPVDAVMTVEDTQVVEKGYRVAPDGMVLHGVKDVDVWMFFHADEAVRIPHRGHCRKSFWHTFGSFGSWRIDAMKKAIPDAVVSHAASSDACDLIRAYLQQTSHGQTYLARQSVIGLYPEPLLGRVIWRTQRVMATTACRKT